MRIENRTKWKTAPLARIARRVLTLECKGRPERARRAKHLRLIIGYNRGKDLCAHSSGYAWLGGNQLHVNIPSGTVSALDFAHVVGHELGHVWGLDHTAMTHVLHYARGGPSNLRYAWAKHIKIEVPAKKIKVKPTADSKLAHAEAQLKKARTRLKRAQTIERKWARKVRAFTRAVQTLPVAACHPPSAA